MAVAQKNSAGIVVAIWVSRTEWGTLRQLADQHGHDFDPVAARFNGVPVYVVSDGVPEPGKVGPWWLRAARLAKRAAWAVRRVAGAVWWQLKWWATSP